jgi:hypothetical protein
MTAAAYTLPKRGPLPASSTPISNCGFPFALEFSKQKCFIVLFYVFYFMCFVKKKSIFYCLYYFSQYKLYIK